METAAATAAAIPSPGVDPKDFLFMKSTFDSTNELIIKGEDFTTNDDGSITLDALAASMLSTGFQATNVGLAINEINRMLKFRLSDRPVTDNDYDEMRYVEVRSKIKCTIFFSYTSNMISCGIRETIRFLCKNKLIDAIVTTGGGVEEDFIKCLGSTYLGDFKLKGLELRSRGINRIGNLLIPNENYCMFEDWITPILHKMTDEQVNEGTRWTPSKLINRLGKEINNEDSVYYWCYKNDIPVFSPAITDGSIGDMIYFHSYKRPEFYLDLVQDIKAINDIAVRSHCTGMIILGGGLVKHHVCNANLMRNGADYSVFINTGQEFDGSDSGASPDEAVSWGKIRMEAKPVKVCADATLVFPLIVSQTFVKELQRQQKELKEQCSLSK